MKGIILAGGLGSRLYPLSLAINKHLMPVYDKPMIYYPISLLMLSGIREILIITRPDQVELFRHLLKDGAQWGIHLSYAIQAEPRGIADAFIVGASFIGNAPVCLTLGDNIFHGHKLGELIEQSQQQLNGCTLFTYSVKNPQDYGILEFDEQRTPINIIEKPTSTHSTHAITGLYLYENDVLALAKSISPSQRNELEISDINKQYLLQKRLRAVMLNRGYAWLDMGTPQSLLNAAQYVALLENRQGLRIMCPEEIAWRKQFIADKQLHALAEQNPNVQYSQYLWSLLEKNDKVNLSDEQVIEA